MNRKVIIIDETKCDGCGLCVNACYDGSIKIIDGKAKLVSREYCCGMEACLPHCPADAITFEERPITDDIIGVIDDPLTKQYLAHDYQWPVKMALVPTVAGYFKDAHLIIASDCTAFIYNDFNGSLPKKRATLIMCPKLDVIDYAEKLYEILNYNDIKTLTVVSVKVPCCDGLIFAAQSAVERCGKNIPLRDIHVDISGKVVRG